MRPKPAPRPAAGTSARPPARICLVGTRGYGARHHENIRSLERAGLAVLTAAVDPFAAADALGPDVPVFDSIEEMDSSGRVADIIVVATPISTHADLAAAALRTGADVLLEKPPVADLAQFHRLLAEEADSCSRVQVGFQSLGSHALQAIDGIIRSGEIGRLRAVGAVGLWARSVDYYTRSPWAGRRTLDGVPVVDGVATNPLAHAVVTALKIAGADHPDDVADVMAELYRVNDIESDDTSVIRLETVSGTPVTCGLTLCAREQQDPTVLVECTEGRIVFEYTRDRLTVETAEGSRVVETGRTDLLTDLIRSRGEGTALLSPLAGAGAFMRVLEAVRTAEEPRPIDGRFVDWTTDGGVRRAVLPGIEEAVARVVKAGTGFSSLGLPWAAPPPTDGTMRVADPGAGRTGTAAGRSTPAAAEVPDSTHAAGGTVEVAVHRTGTELAAANSPRPFLHPVRTTGGVVVTDQQPLDHVWHTGVGVAIQDVAGVNLWGGRTFTASALRYEWRDDHGRVVVEESTDTAGARDESLIWCGPDAAPLLTERRRWSHRAVAHGVWELGLDFTLLPAGRADVSVGSPGSNGRTNGGYGGFFWRLAPVADAQVFTSSQDGEEAVHGSTDDWLAVSGRFADGEATLVFRRGDAAGDPWFVRLSGYPGVGLSLAWENRVTTTSAAPLTRSVRVLVVDGTLTRDEAAALHTEASRTSTV
nr:DUF6807 family protein [Brevibacterium yomogidense]